MKRKCFVPKCFNKMGDEDSDFFSLYCIFQIENAFHSIDNNSKNEFKFILKNFSQIWKFH